MNTEVIDLLKRARERISAPERWTKDWFAKDKDGYPVYAGSQEAACWCIRGAFISLNPCVPTKEAAYELICAHLPVRGMGIAEFNDLETTTHADILALFDRTIADLEAAP